MTHTATIDAAAFAALTERVERLESAVRWALGYDEGGPDFADFVAHDGPPRYAWRTELRRRAALDAAPAPMMDLRSPTGEPVVPSQLVPYPPDAP